jgi:hydrogenase-1 operon protein HyaF
MPLRDIPITVVPTASDEALNAPALLSEIAVLLERLVESDATESIDLRSLPLAPADYACLEEVLGQGEVSAEIDAAGPTRVRETAVHGVWWVTHLNALGEPTAEFIEVTYAPEILKTHPSDAQAGLARLRSHLADTQGDPANAA